MTDFTPCHAADGLDRLIFYTERRIDREYMIWELGSMTDLSYKQIGQMIGCSEGSAGNVFRRISAIGEEDEIMEYFKIAFDLYDILAELGGNPDRNLNYLLGGMLRVGICRRDRIGNLTLRQLEDFLARRDVYNAGKLTKEAFREYRRRLKNGKIFQEGESNGRLENAGKDVRMHSVQDYGAGKKQHHQAEKPGSEAEKEQGAG